MHKIFWMKGSQTAVSLPTLRTLIPMSHVRFVMNILHRTHTNATRKVGKYACDASVGYTSTNMEKIELRGMSNQLCAPSFTPLCMCLFGEKSSSKARSSRSNLKYIEVDVLIRGNPYITSPKGKVGWVGGSENGYFFLTFSTVFMLT